MFGLAEEYYNSLKRIYDAWCQYENGEIDQNDFNNVVHDVFKDWRR